MNIAMIGLGKLGLPVAEVMAGHHHVRGYDINPNTQSDSVEICQSLSLACEHADCVFIAVPTPHQLPYGGQTPSSHLPPCDFDYQHLRTALTQVKTEAPLDCLIVIISTVLPGTLRSMIDDLNLSHRLCYNPYLIAMGTVMHDFVNPDIMIMGFDQWPTHQHRSQADQLINFYASMQQRKPHITCGTWEEAECIKIFHNTYISAKVGIANMIQDVTHQIGHANPSTIAESLRHADRIVSPAYMEPGMGDGGPCHPRDNIALSWLADRLNLGYDLFGDIMRARECQAERVADLVCSQELPVVILGRSFKAGVTLTDGSAAELVAHYCGQRGHAVTWDVGPYDEPAVFLLAHDQDYSDRAFAQGSVIVDMYRRFPRDRQGITVIWYGVKPEAPPQ